MKRGGKLSSIKLWMSLGKSNKMRVVGRPVKAKSLTSCARAGATVRSGAEDLTSKTWTAVCGLRSAEGHNPRYYSRYGRERRGGDVDAWLSLLPSLVAGAE